MKSRSALSLASQIAGVLYLLWRIAFTYHGANAALFVMLLAVDVLVVTRHFLRIWTKNDVGEPFDPHVVGMAPISPVILDVGQEPLVELRVSLRACLELRGATSITVIDRLGRSDVAELCNRYRVERRVPTQAKREAHIATEVMNDSAAELVTIVPGSVWAPADAIELGAAALNQPHVSAVGMPAAHLGRGQHIGTSGYPLFAELDQPIPGATSGVVVMRADLLKKAGGFLPGNGDFLARTLDDLNSGWAESVSLGPGIAHRPAPWDEDLALRRRVDQVGRQQTAREAHRLVEAWSVVPRTFALCLPVVVALTGWLPLTTSFTQAAVFGLPWFVLAAMSRAEMRAVPSGRVDGHQPHWSDLRSGMRTLTADFLGLVRGSSLAIPPGQIAARHLRVVGVIGVLAFVGCFAQLLGRSLNEIGDLASVAVVLASVGVLGLVRDSTWAQSDRERRVLPRSAPTQTNEIASSISPYGANIAESFAPGTELALRLSMPQPGRNRWERNITGVVQNGPEGSKAASGSTAPAGSYVQFDLDSDILDELLYFCGVTSPTLRRLEQSVPSGIVSLRKTGRMRAIEPLRLTDEVTRSRGAFESAEAVQETESM